MDAEKLQMQVLDAASVKPSGEVVPLHPKRPKAISLKSLGQLRRELQRVYTDARTGRLETQTAARLTYILSIVGRVLEVEAIERRIDALEAHTKEGR